MKITNFMFVTAEAFIAFKQILEQDEWEMIDITSYVGPNWVMKRSVGDAPATVLRKVRMLWALTNLEIVRKGAGDAKMRDRHWDNMQKRLFAFIDAASMHADANIREAAERLRKLLLLGAGQAQTKLKYHQEVDFGRQQVEITSSGEAAADIALLGLEQAIDDIRQATEDLALCIGYGQGSMTPAARVRAAMTACCTTFDAIATELEWIAEHGEIGIDRTRAAELRAPLEALSARYPAIASQPEAKDDEEADAEPTPADESSPV
jgi:hypothetical protein